MKLWKRILSCFLALLLTVYLLPVQVMAEELGDLWPLTTENIAETPPDVIGEVLERREENQKEFLLANGVRQVVIYPAAVHYQKDGQWKDIDKSPSACDYPGRRDGLSECRRYVGCLGTRRTEHRQRDHCQPEWI